jgi:hypothetical protein
MCKKKIGVIYNLIHERVKEIQAPKNFIWRKDLFTILGRIYHIPKPSRHQVMYEMVDYGMLKTIKQDFLEIQ